VVLDSTNSSTVGNFKLFVSPMTLPVHFVVAPRYVLEFMPLYLCPVAWQAYVPAVIFRDICPLC